MTTRGGPQRPLSGLPPVGQHLLLLRRPQRQRWVAHQPLLLDEEADIATGDYGHRLRILVDEYIKNRDGDPSLRHSAKAIPEPASETAYRKLRLAYTPHWHAFHSSAMARYEDMVAG